MQVFHGQTRLINHQSRDAAHHYPVSRMPFFASGMLLAFAWLTRPFAVILARRPRAEDVVAAEYEGRSWCDSTERELIHDVETWPHRR